MVMFWVKAISMVFWVSSRVVMMCSASYIFVRSFMAAFASSRVRSLCMFVCFHIAFRLSAKAISTVQRMQSFLRRLVIVVLASLDSGSFTTSFMRMLESRISFGVLCPP